MLIWGLLLSMVVTAVWALALIKLKDSSFTILAWIVGLALLVFLTFENTRLFNAIEERGQIDDIVCSVENCLRSTFPNITRDYRFDEAGAQQIALMIKVSDPSVAKYVHASDFQGKDWSSVTVTLQKVIRKSSGRYIGYRIGWCLLALILASGIVLLLGMEKGNRRRNNKYGAPRSYDTDIEF